MEQLTPRQIRALQTKQTILETALELFSKKGFDQVTVDEIVTKSNVSKGAFYVHFKSKYEIFHEKFKEIDEFYSTFTQSLPEGMSNKEKLIYLIRSQMAYIRDNLGIDLMRNVYLSAVIPSQENDYLSNTERPLYKIVSTYVRGGQESGEFRTDISAKEITMYITRCMRGTFYDWFLFKDEYHLVEEAEKYISLFLDSLKTNTNIGFREHESG